MSMIVITSVMLILFAVNMRLYLAVFAAVLLYFVCYAAGVPLQISVQRLIGPTQNMSLLAIPFFILLGSLLNYTGIARRMLRLSDLLVGKLTGGMALTNIMVSTIMGGFSASNLADSAMLTRMMVPEMEKQGYNRAFSAAVTASGALVTPIIPPGIALIIYGLVADVSIGKMFMAGILPGLVMAGLLLVTTYFISKQKGYKPARTSWPTPVEARRTVIDSWPAVLLVVLILGGIRANVFTPTEAGACAVIIALLIGFFADKNMRLVDVGTAVNETVKSTATVMLVVMACSAMAWVFSLEHAGDQLAKFIISLTSNKYVFLIVVNVALLILGCLMEGNAILIVLVPLLKPVVVQMGIDPVHFGIVMIVNLAIGCLTPPVGTVMLLVCNLANVRIVEFMKEGFWLIVALLVSLLIVTFVPSLSLLLT